MRSAHSGSLSEAIGIKGRPALPHAADQLSRHAQRCPQDDDQFAPTLVLNPSASMQHSPLPANALVAYSSDDDDWQNAVDATESKLQR